MRYFIILYIEVVPGCAFGVTLLPCSTLEVVDFPACPRFPQLVREQGHSRIASILSLEGKSKEVINMFIEL